MPDNDAARDKYFRIIAKFYEKDNEHVLECLDDMVRRLEIAFPGVHDSSNIYDPEP